MDKASVAERLVCLAEQLVGPGESRGRKAAVKKVVEVEDVSDDFGPGACGFEVTIDIVNANPSEAVPFLADLLRKAKALGGDIDAFDIEGSKLVARGMCEGIPADIQSALKGVR